MQEHSSRKNCNLEKFTPHPSRFRRGRRCCGIVQFCIAFRSPWCNACTALRSQAFPTRRHLVAAQGKAQQKSSRSVQDCSRGKRGSSLMQLDPNSSQETPNTAQRSSLS
ncbi:hypothetical protein Mapa_015778 [Marchantia paleacea]|nr:hypothetical protein Mapa_015778 [Marchantia paleacea]